MIMDANEEFPNNPPGRTTLGIYQVLGIYFRINILQLYRNQKYNCKSFI